MRIGIKYSDQTAHDRSICVRMLVSNSDLFNIKNTVLMFKHENTEDRIKVQLLFQMGSLQLQRLYYILLHLGDNCIQIWHLGR